MKKIIFSIFVCSLFFSQQLFSQDLKSDFIFDLQINNYPPQVIGHVLKGTRVIFPFREGLAKGDKINGKILESGGDWALVIDSTTFKVDARATVVTDDSAMIYISYSGYSYANAKTLPG